MLIIYYRFVGAVVQFRRLQKKYSQKGNAYCRFDVCSSLKVEQMASARYNASSEIRPFLGPKIQGTGRDAERSPNANIIDLIRQESCGRLIQTIVRVRCRVTKVQRAVLRWTCCKCGHSVVKEECSATCGMSSGCKFNAELRSVVKLHIFVFGFNPSIIVNNPCMGCFVNVSVETIC